MLENNVGMQNAVLFVLDTEKAKRTLEKTGALFVGVHGGDVTQMPFIVCRNNDLANNLIRRLGFGKVNLRICYNDDCSFPAVETGLLKEALEKALAESGMYFGVLPVD